MFWYTLFARDRSVELGDPMIAINLAPKAIRKYFLPYRGRFIAVYAMSVAVAALQLAPPLLIRRLIDKGISSHSYVVVVTSVAAIASVAFGIGLLDFFQGWLNTWSAEHALGDLRSGLFRLIIRAPFSFFRNNSKAEVTNRAGNDAEIIRRAVSRANLAFATGCVDVIVVSVGLLVLDWRLALAVGALSVAFGLPIGITAIAMHGHSSFVSARRDQLTALVQRLYSVNGISLMKIFAASSFEKNAIEHTIRELYQARLTLSRKNALLMLWGTFLVGLAPVTIWLIGGLQNVRGEITVGTIIAAAAYVTQLLPALSMVAALAGPVTAAGAAFSRIVDLLFIDPEQQDGRDAKDLFKDDSSLRFNAASSLGDSGEPIVSGITLSISKPGYYAVVGPSGAGKSSLLQLAIRNISLSDGTVEVGGADIATLNPGTIRDVIVVVPQDPFMHNDTLTNVIQYGASSVSRETLEATVRLALVDAFAYEPTRGLQFQVGENGRHLSGGERQRIAIARALLLSPPVIVFDEATSELDYLAEAKLLSNVRSAFKTNIIINITHRLGTVVDADEIFLIAGGRLADKGRHRELMERSALYRALFEYSTKGDALTPR